MFTSIAPTTATVGTVYTYTPVATDADSDSVTFSIGSGQNPVGSGFSSSTYTWTPTSTQAGVLQDLKIIASDGKGGTTEQSWTITPVMPTTPAGTLHAAGNVVTAAGETATFELSFSAPATPQAMQISPRMAAIHVASSTLGQATGLLTFAPGQVSIGGILMGGTFDPATAALVLTGGGYEFDGTAVIQNGQLTKIDGTFKTLSTGQTGPAASLSAQPLDAQAGTFTATGSLAQARTNHSATLLNNGQVLVTGGEGLVASMFTRMTKAELYNPASGTFSSTGDMNYGTSEHSATLLPDGTVLIIGGRDNNNQATDRVERYNPATGQFTLQNSLNHGRLEYHSATLLPNGKVLVVGGASLPGGTTGSGVAVAELYEPDATNGPNPARKGKATDTGSLSVPRNQHYAMVSPSNSNYVLILGGFVGGDGGDSTLTEEAYNITTGHFEIIQPTPTTKRGGGTLMYLGGLRWLNAGGLNHDTNMVLSSAEIVDGNANGGSGAIIPTGSMPISTCLSSSVLLLDGRVFVCGGFSDLNTMAGVASAVVFNPTANGGVGAFTETQNTMSSPRWNHTATLLANGKVLVVGGQTTNDQSAVASADLYN